MFYSKHCFVLFALLNCGQLLAADTNKICKSLNQQKNDKFITGYNSNYAWNKNAAYNDENSNFILTYLVEPPKDISVISKYRNCEKNITNCNCASIIRLDVGDGYKYAYIDICNKDLRLDSGNNVALEYYSESDGVYSRIDCSHRVYDNQDWDKVPVSFNTFQCASTNSSFYKLRVFFDSLDELPMTTISDVTDNIYVTDEDTTTDEYTTTESNRAKSSATRRIILEVNFVFTPAIRSSSGSEDEVNEIALILDESSKTAYHVRTDLCGPYEYKSHSFDPDKGYSIANTNTDFNWNFDLKKNQVQSCDLANNNQYIYSAFGKRLNKADGFQVNKNYILYQDEDILRVTTKFKKCNNGNGLCHCSLAVETTDSLSSTYAFIDACEANPDVNKKFKFYDSRDKDTLKSGKFELLNCDSQTIDDEKDESQWAGLQANKHFKCAKLTAKNRAGNSCNTYALEAKISSKTLRLKVDVDCADGSIDSYLSSITLIPPKTIGKNIGGLCGHVDSLPSCSPYGCLSPVLTTDLEAYWNIDGTSKNWKLDLSSYIDSYECNLYNYDKSIQLFDSNRLFKDKEMYEISSPLVLYDHDQEVMVYSRFKYCKKTARTAYCLCSVYIRVNNADPYYAFIDFCSSSGIAPNYNLDFQHFRSPNEPEYKNLDCSAQIFDENNEDEWAKVKTTFKYFKCARIFDDCKKYVIRTIGTGKNIQVQVDVECPDDQMDFLSQVTINPTLKAQNYSKGLCGYWYHMNTDENNLEFSKITNSDVSLADIVLKNSINSYENSGLLPRDSNTMVNRDKPPIHDFTIDKYRYCSFNNDPHMKIFEGSALEYQYAGDYVLYKTDRIMIIGRFKRQSSTVALNCGLVIIVNYDSDDYGHHIEPFPNMCGDNRQLPYYSNEAYLKCETTKKADLQISDPFNNYHWYETYQNGRNSFNAQNVDCYRTISSGADNYYVKIEYSLNPNRTEKISQTLIRIVKSSQTISSLIVYPSVYARNHSIAEITYYNGGVCGTTQRFWEGPYIKENVLWYKDYDGNYKKPSLYKVEHGLQPEAAFANYWEAKYQINNPNRKNAANSVDIPFDKYKISKRDQILNEKFLNKNKRKYKVDEATEICNNRLGNDELVLNQEFEEEREKLIEMCISDIQLTDDTSWVEVHWISLKNLYLSMILQDENNFGEDNLLLDEVIELYKINCPNDCSGNGRCFKNPECSFGRQCDYILLCDCKQSYGSDDCSVRTSTAPEFELVETCCNTRTMNCEKIEGVAERLSNNNTLYYKMRIIVDSIEKRSFTNKVDWYSTNYFEVIYPFGYIPEIQQHSVTVMFGIGYNLDNFDWKNITFYDPKCRTCTNGKLNDDLVQGTCITKNLHVCSQLANGKCSEPNPCSGGSDLGLIIQGSNKPKSGEFDILKNILAELVGRLKVGPNQVHVGYMHYSQRVKTFSSVRLSDQGQSSFMVDRLIDLFYIPYSLSPIASALSKSSRELFRPSGRSYLVPQVALLVNDAASNPWADLGPPARELADRNIEVIALGIGNAIDLNELKVATNNKDQNIIRMNSYKSLYENIDTIVQKVCSLSVEFSLNELYHQRLGSYDYRYFRTNLRGIKSSFIEFRVDELQSNNKVNFYYSFDIKNPVKENSGRFTSTRQETTRMADQSLRVSNYHLIYVPSGKTEIYYTLETLDRSANVDLVVYEIDF